MTCWALLPLKAAAQRKTRLAPVLKAAERASLSLDMLLHVARAVRNSRCVDRIAVLCPEPLDLPAWLHQLRDTRGELNSALLTAVREIRQEAGVDCAVVLPDLPLLNADEVRRLVAAGKQRKIAIAPDKTGRGTNAIWIDAAIDFEFCFGPDSFARHLRCAQALTPHPDIVKAPGLAFDLDTPLDLTWYRGADPRRGAVTSAPRRALN